MRSVVRVVISGVVAGVLLALVVADAVAADIAQVYLIQNSGWMEPFYTDPQSQFRPLLKAFAAATQSRPGRVIVASFNQNGQLPDRRSPHVVFEGPYDRGRVDVAIDAVDLPIRKDGKFTDADFFGSFSAAVNDVLKRQPGILWIMTNNKNSPNNSPQVIENTRKFSASLSESDAIASIVAFPLRMNVTGQVFKERGLIIYGIAYGKDADVELGRIVGARAIEGMFTEPPVRLKPLAEAALRFEPVALETPGVSASLENGIMVFRGVPAWRPSEIVVRGRLISDYYPYVIEHGVTTLHWGNLQGFPAGVQASTAITPAVVRRLAPREVLSDVRLTIGVPALERPAGLAGLLKDKAFVTGSLRMGLRDVRLGLQQAFANKVSDVFGLDQLLPIFFAHRDVHETQTRIPVAIVVTFSAWPLILVTGGGIVAALLAVAGPVLAMHKRAFALLVDGAEREYRLRPWQTETIKNGQGKPIGTIQGTAFGRPTVTRRDAKARIAIS